MAATNSEPERARAALELLADKGESVSKAALWEQVVNQFPLRGTELAVYKSGLTRGEVSWGWTTAEFVKAGWLQKGGPAGWSITPEGVEALRREPGAENLRMEARNLYTAWSKTRDKARTDALSAGIVPQEYQEEALRAARLFVERGFISGSSVFSPDRSIWTTEVTSELVQLFVQSDGAVGASFLEKVANQLGSASDDAKLLMAELVTFQLLPMWIETIGELRKRERVAFLLSLMDHPVRVPAEIDVAFSGGSFNPGQRMATNLAAALTIIINFVAAWAQFDTDEREKLLADPWAMRELLQEIPGERFPSQRQALLYLLHPDIFVSIVSEADKDAIRARFIGEVGGISTDDIDKDLLAITIALQVKGGGPVSYYQEPLYSEWHPNETSDRPEQAQAENELYEDNAAGARACFPRVTPELAQSVFMDAGWPQMALDLLERRRQIILHGPPGTGKTYLARKLAEHVAAGAETVLVQFHPSYSYEDFVEGYRPISENGTLSYQLKEGPFRRIARQAAKNPDRNYVLVIDEINRGNLPKIFGELYFLLEYRDAQIALLYGSETDFALPENVFIIGTMNTTDRSIALLDRAMRRRFAFIEMHPDIDPTASVLPRWLESRNLPLEPALLLNSLNARIPERAARIGPSYLMPSDGDLSDARLTEIWRHELIPLLEEYHYGETRDLDSEYGLAALRRRLSAE